MAKSWSKCVLDIIKRSRYSQARVAKEVGISAPLLNYYLKGEREPSKERAFEISNAISELTGTQFGLCLDAIFILEHADRTGEPIAFALSDKTVRRARLGDINDEIQDLGTVIQWALRMYCHGYLKSDVLHYLQSALVDHLNSRDVLKFVDSLVVGIFKRIICELNGDEPLLHRIEEFKNICQRHKFDISGLLKDESETEILKNFEAFESTVRGVIFDLSIGEQNGRPYPVVPLRNIASHKIIRAFEDVIRVITEETI